MSKAGWRIILIVPETNTTMGRELRAIWPEIAELQIIGVPRPLRPIVIEDLPAYQEATLAAAHDCEFKKPDLVLYGCTTAGFLAGPKGDLELATALSEVTAAPVVTTASSMVAALRYSNVRRPAIVTPYLDASNQALIRFLAEFDMQASLLDSFYLKSVDDYNKVTKEKVRDFAVPAGRTPEADGLFIACTQLPTLGILDDIRIRINKPVWSAVQATFWAGKRKVTDLETTARVPGV